MGSRIAAFALPVHKHAYRRGQQLQAGWGGRMVAIGLGLSRFRFLDRYFPVCIAGWRLVRMPEPVGLTFLPPRQPLRRRGQSLLEVG